MIYWQLFVAFFIPSIIGYGGGPAYIPLVEYEVVHRYGWLTAGEFGEILAFANTLPGPIITKMAGVIGFEIAGAAGALVGLAASVIPSLILMIFLLGIIYRYKDNLRIKRVTRFVRPVIAAMLALMVYNFFINSFADTGVLDTAGIALVSFLLLEKLKIQPPLVILAALLYGALVL